MCISTVRDDAAGNTGACMIFMFFFYRFYTVFCWASQKTIRNTTANTTKIKSSKGRKMFNSRSTEKSKQSELLNTYFDVSLLLLVYWCYFLLLLVAMVVVLLLRFSCTAETKLRTHIRSECIGHARNGNVTTKHTATESS